MLVLLVLAACQPTPDSSDTGPSAVPWSGDLPSLQGELGLVRGFTPLRAIVHLHSPYSHDACDGEGFVDGVLDESCLAEERDGLCRVGVDVAFLTDHPAYAATVPWQDTLLVRGDDEIVELDGRPVASRIRCEGGHEVLWVPGFEDELMPVGIEESTVPPGDELVALYNRDDAEAIAAMQAAGALVLQAHPEERSAEELARRQDDGLAGLELYNLHALLDPGECEEIYGLDAFGWVQDIGPFSDEDGTAEPDLLFLAFHQELLPNVERWDQLAARGPAIGTAGTDAHRNVLPILLRDGERPDGFRRNMRWFSNHLLAREPGFAGAEEALASGRSYAAFEVLGTPDGLAFWYEEADGTAREMGEQASPGGSLHLDCPLLSPSSPRDGSGPPEISATVFRDGQPWQEGCGAWEVAEPGVYRVRIDILPSHLAGFLGEDPAPFLHAFPWVYTNPIRVAEGG